MDPRSLWRLLRESLEDALALDGRLPRTLGALVFQPGRLTEAWRRGRRVSWMHPFRLYLVCSLTFFTLSLVVEINATFTVGSGFSADPAMAAAQSAAQQRALGTVAPQALILVVPLLALILRVVFRGGLTYVEHLVHALHIQSFLFVLLLSIFALSLLPASFAPWFALVLALVFVLYLGASARRVYETGRWSTVVGSLFTLIGFFVISMSTLGAAVLLFQEDPEMPLREAEEGYWALHDRFERGDTARGAASGQSLALEYEALALYLMNPRARAHHAEAKLWADSAVVALRLAEQGLVVDPESPLLLRVAGLAAEQAGDSAAAAGYRSRFLESYDPGAIAADHPRHAPDLAAFRDRVSARGRGEGPSSSPERFRHQPRHLVPALRPLADGLTPEEGVGAHPHQFLHQPVGPAEMGRVEVQGRSLQAVVVAGTARHDLVVAGAERSPKPPFEGEVHALQPSLHEGVVGHGEGDGVVRDQDAAEPAVLHAGEPSELHRLLVRGPLLAEEDGEEDGEPDGPDHLHGIQLGSLAGEPPQEGLVTLHGGGVALQEPGVRRRIGAEVLLESPEETELLPILLTPVPPGLDGERQEDGEDDEGRLHEEEAPAGAGRAGHAAQPIPAGPGSTPSPLGRLDRRYWASPVFVDS